MADPLISVAKTIKNEGGWVDNPNDPGGVTNMGITQRDMPGQNMRELPIAQATAYYMQNYVKLLYPQIQSQAVLDKLIDMGVLFGVGEAVEQLQSVLAVTVDGQFGEVTLQAVNTAAGSLLASYKTAMKQRAYEIVALHPSEVVFEAGWAARIDS